MLIEAHEEWQVRDRRYLSEASMAELATPTIHTGQAVEPPAKITKPALTAA